MFGIGVEVWRKLLWLFFKEKPRRVDLTLHNITETL